MNIVDDRAGVRRAFSAIIPENGGLKYLSVLSLIMDIKLVNGEYLFTAKNLADIYDLYFLFNSSDGPKVAHDFITNVVVPTKNEMILKNEPELFSTIIFESPLLAVAQQNEENVLALQNDRGELSDSSTCGRCGNG